MQIPRTLPKTLVALTASAALALSLSGPVAVADPPQPPGTKASPVAKDNRAEQATQTLAEVQAIVAGDAVTRGGHTTDGRDLTVALRDLKVQMKYLSPSQRKTAERFFLRPGSGGDPYIPGTLDVLRCQGEICLHYTEDDTDGNAVLGSDGDNATIPAYVTSVLNTINQINNDYVAAGYRTPKRDGAIGGGTDKIDIYLGEIGTQGLYGFCTSDQTPVSGDYSLWAYCALDNDYAPSEFPSNTPLENMQVTAAHEFFHAVQYAYDAYEDGWIIESTATWVEDEMFDAVDDNRFYLGDSPLKKPGKSMDQFGGLFHYGVWIWWRYLTEKFPGKTGKLPNLVLAVWNWLDGAPAGPDNYSTQGLAKVLSARGTSLKKEFQLFSAANRHPKTVYEEGNAYPSAPADVITVTKARSAWNIGGKLNHLAAGTVRLNPKELTGAWKLKFNFDLVPGSRGAGAVIVVYKKNGAISTSIVKLNSTGGGSKTGPFSSGS
uniref:MXAN_6640 family putative metalloprotease n=1 Tax=Nocardioides stalactiti TaxID=2755356 RepID=UPI001C81F068